MVAVEPPLSYLPAYSFTVEFGGQHYAVRTVDECNDPEKGLLSLRMVYGLTERDEGVPNILLAAHLLQKKVCGEEKLPEVRVHHKTREGDVAVTRVYKVCDVFLGFGPLSTDSSSKAMAEVVFDCDPTQNKVHFHDLAIPRKEREIAALNKDIEDGDELAAVALRCIGEAKVKVEEWADRKAATVATVVSLGAELKTLKHAAESK